MPFPAGGCDTCRKRRVKCGGERPNCRQCQKANRICFGLEKQQNTFTFVIDNPKVGQKVVSPWKNSHQIRTPPRDSLRPALNIALEEQALSYYFSNWAPETTDIAAEHSRYLPIMWMQAPLDSTFCLSVLATSQSAFGNARKNPEAWKTSRSMYFRAVSKMKDALQDPEQSCSDQMLLASMVLSAYECTSFGQDGEGVLAKPIELDAQVGRAFTHHDGATAILKERQRRGLFDNRRLLIDKTCRRQLLRSALLRRTGVPSWLEDGVVFGEIGILLKLDKCMIQVTRIQKTAETLAEAGDLNADELDTITLQLECTLGKAAYLDNDMLLCERQLPDDWNYQVHDIRHDSIHDMIYGQTVHVYPSHAHASIWLRHRIVRIMLKSAILKLLSIRRRYLDPDPAFQPEDTLSAIQDLVDTMCATIPYLTYKIRLDENGKLKLLVKDRALSKMNATTVGYLAFPLHGLIETFTVCDIPVSQQDWIRNQMIHVSRAAGDRLLERIAVS